MDATTAIYGPAYERAASPDDDERAVLDAYLADHPADDDELIDERWLQSLGCQRREEWQAWVVPNDDQCVTLSRSASYPDLWDLQYETDFQWPNGLRFKRDLRVVLRALLIELTEGPAVR
jgi:hypothetical protein